MSEDDVRRLEFVEPALYRDPVTGEGYWIPRLADPRLTSIETVLDEEER